MTQIRDNQGESRFELDEDGQTAIAAYRRDGDTIVFTHTEVPDALAGRGVGTRLVEGALAIVRERGQRIVPACSFVAHHVETHPDTRDLMA